jgi:hypothetical protein
VLWSADVVIGDAEWIVEGAAARGHGYFNMPTICSLREGLIDSGRIMSSRRPVIIEGRTILA